MGILSQNKERALNERNKADRLILHLEEKWYSKKESYDMVFWNWESKWIAEKRGWIDNKWKTLEKWTWVSTKETHKVVNNPFKNEYMKRMRSKGGIWK